MQLTLSQEVYTRMVAAARSAAPLEACGLLGGAGDHITQCHVLTNVDASAEHYSMKPEEQFAAIKAMRAAGLKMRCIWHSHPASPARMSAEDMRLAYTPDVVYVIISLAGTGEPTVRGFVVEDDVSREMPINIEPGLQQ